MTTDTYPTIPQTPPPPPPPPTPQKRKGGFAKKAFIGLLVVSVIAVFGAVGYVKWTESKIERIASEELVSLATVTPGTSEPLNFLIIATDDRSNLPDDWDEAVFGEFSGRRTDVMMLAHMVPGERIQLLSLPRDLKVDIDGNGTNRLNASYVFGGPDLLIKTVQQETGIPVHHFIEIDFGGFGRIVDSLGGVTMDFALPGRDNKSGFQVEAGTHTLDGEAAVAYARSRHYEVYKDGSWQGTSGGDIARTQRQQDILVQLFDQVASPSSAFNLPSFLPTVADNITADEGLSLALMADLGRSALSLRAANIDRVTLPVKNFKGSDGRAYVVPTDGADAVLKAFKIGGPYP